MDIQAILRHRPYLILVVLVGLGLLAARPAFSQMATCPDFTSTLAPPPGNWPGTMALCIDPADDQTSIGYAPEAPCGGYVSVHKEYVDLLPPLVHPLLYITPPPNMTFPSGQAKLSFIFDSVATWGIQNSYDGNTQLRIESFSAGGSRIASSLINSSSYPLTTGDPILGYTSGHTHYFLIEDVELTAVQGGYLTIQPIATSSGGLITIRDYHFTSVRVNDREAFIPPLCLVPGSDYTPSPTPTPTFTPTHTPSPTLLPGSTVTATPTATPTGTWNPTATPWPTGTATPWPTSVGGTPSPHPSQTPIPLNTLPAGSTPTPFPVAQMPTLSLPSLTLPGVGDFTTPGSLGVALTPNATGEARIAAIETEAAQTGLVVTRWHTATNQALGVLAVNVTHTSGISTPVQMADGLIRNLTLPISTLKSIQQYFPNLWWFILFLLITTGWIFFVLFVKFSIAIISEPAELLRRLIELIPGF